MVAALWAVLASVDAVRGSGSWAYCAAALILLAIGLTMRLRSARRRTRM
ncbi:hypothetical protein [Streptomyces shaanxiensis]